jgi:hypothetical protein
VRSWKDRLNGNVISWLLESKDPSLRFLTLVDLIGVRPDSSEGLEAREALMSGGPVAKILAAQQPGGHWGREEDFYVRSKYHGTVWNVSLLAEMAADPGDERVRKAGEFVLNWSMRPDGGFTHRGTAEGGEGLAMPCLSGNMAWSLSRLGFRDDPRVQRSLKDLINFVRGAAPGFSKGRCASCRSGTVKVLKALAEVPSPDTEMRSAIASLRAKVARECLPGQGREPRPEWGQVWFPLFWNTDLVEILDILGRTGGLIPEASSAIDAVLSKQDSMGRWALEGSFRGRCLVTFEPLRKPSRWATFRVLRMLKNVRP